MSKTRVAALLVFCAGLGNAQTALHSITGYTPTASGIEEFSVLVFDDDGRVLAVGGEATLDAYPHAQRVDGGNLYALPGLIDAHAHLASLGMASVSLDLVGTRSLGDALARIEGYAGRHPNRGWLLGQGWNQELWPDKRFPAASDLDAVVQDRPVLLDRIDGHAVWVNTAALRIAGIDDETPDPPGGHIVRDRRGVATGVLIDSAMGLVTRHVPAPSEKDLRNAYATASQRILAEGLTGVHDAGVGLTEARVLMSMAEAGDLPIRVYAMISGADENLDAVGEPLIGYGGDRLDIRSVKLYSDGALGSRGAALLEPYSDLPVASGGPKSPRNRGLLLRTAADLRADIVKTNGLGFQVAIHAIGDRGNRIALDAFDKAQRELSEMDGSPGGHAEPETIQAYGSQTPGARPEAPGDFRNRIEHAQILSLDDIPRLAPLGLIASIQPTHATSDMNMAEKRIGPERIKGGYAWRRLLNAGATLAAGSDFPVERSNPFHGLYAAVTRQDRHGNPSGGWYPDQALTRAEALRAFTIDAAYAAHQEKRVGSLEPGKWADFIVVDRDYFKVPADEIDDIKVLETWVAGRRCEQNNPEGPRNREGTGNGGQGQNRTADTRIFSPLLYRLSYLAD